MEIIESKLDHILAVACKMFRIAPHYNLPREEAFVLGLLHESGILYTNGINSKYEVGGSILGKEGYPYWREVYYTLNPDPSYESEMLHLLNYAELTTDLNGNDISIDERIMFVLKKWGKDSKEFRDLVKLYNKLKQKGY